MKTLLSSIVAMFAAMFLCSTGYAQTPDGETPSEETFCDQFTGQLRGLCNAFCEATDCDSPDPHASANACLKLERKIGDLLEEYNATADPKLEITASKTEGGAVVPGNCGVKTTEVSCPCLAMWDNGTGGPVLADFDQHSSLGT